MEREDLFGFPAWSPLGYLKYKAADFTNLPLNLSAVWYPRDKNEAFQPYVGAGVHYTRVKAKFTSQFRSDLLAIPGVTVPMVDAFENSLKKNTWGASLMVGADYSLDKNWLVNGQLRYLQFSKSDGQLIYMASVGYRF